MTHGAPQITDLGSQFEDISPKERDASVDRIDGQNLVSAFYEQRTFKHRPCDTCRKRKSRCVVNEGAPKCVLCLFRGQDCTFLEDVPPRKRKSVNCDEELER